MKGMNPKQNWVMCQRKARRTIPCLSSLFAKYQHCINDDSKQHFTINRQLKENKQHFLYLRDKGRLGKLMQCFRVQWYRWVFQSLCIRDLILSHPMNDLTNTVWYPLAHFFLPEKRGRKNREQPISGGEPWRLVPRAWGGGGRGEIGSPGSLSGEQQFSLPKRTAVGTPAAGAATVSQNSSPDRLRNPICPLMPSTENGSAFLLGVCAKSLILWALTFTLELEVK